jgi:Tropinone reductase 1
MPTDGRTPLAAGRAGCAGDRRKPGHRRAVCAELLGLGADVLMVARDQAQLAASAGELEDAFPERIVRTLAADVADAEQRREILGLGGGPRRGPEHPGQQRRRQHPPRPRVDYADDEWRSIFEANLFSAFDLSRFAHPLLTRHATSSIVNVGSVSGLTHVRTGAAYGMSKAALHQLTQNLACEWAEDGVRVNAVAPWYIRTRRTSDALAEPEYYEEVIARTPMGRVGEPEEVRGAVAWLCLPAASYVTGECIAVDGGFLRYGF